MELGRILGRLAPVVALTIVTVVAVMGIAGTASAKPQGSGKWVLGVSNTLVGNGWREEINDLRGQGAGARERQGFEGGRGVTGTIRKYSLDTLADLGFGLGFANRLRQPARNLFSSLRQIFRHVVQNLRAVVGCALRPSRRFARSLHRVADVFAIPVWRFAKKLAVSPAHFNAVAGVGSRLLATNVKLHGAVDRRVR